MSLALSVVRLFFLGGIYSCSNAPALPLSWVAACPWEVFNSTRICRWTVTRLHIAFLLHKIYRASGCGLMSKSKMSVGSGTVQVALGRLQMQLIRL